MRGEIMAVWSETWRQVWRPLADHADAPDDLFCELYRELNSSLEVPLDPATELAAIVDNPDQAHIAFRSTKPDQLAGEAALVAFLERAHEVVEDVGSSLLVDRYFALIERFLDKFSLRYDLRRPFTLHPTLPGLFARLVLDLRKITYADSDLHQLMVDYEDALRDLKIGPTPARMKTCFMKQFNLLEALASKHPNATKNTLGKICGELHTWPHPAMQAAASSLYGFRSYPGVGHGASGGKLREIEMRDLVGVSVLLAGLTPYLTELLDPPSIYAGS